MMDGRKEKVPVLTPKYAQHYCAMGRILSHGYVLTGYLPMCFSSYFFIRLLGLSDPDVESVSVTILMESFLNYVDEGEAVAITKCLNNAPDLPRENIEHVIVPLLSRFNCTSIVSQDNVVKLLKEAALYALFCLPFYALTEIRKGMLSANPHLWLDCPASVGLELRRMLIPTSIRVWNMVEEPPVQNRQQSTTFDYFRRFVFSLNENTLELLLRFITGSPHCGDQKMHVHFSEPETPFLRRPTANTCGMVLYLPTTYSSFSQFTNEFKEILANSHLWSFDFS